MARLAVFFTPAKVSFGVVLVLTCHEQGLKAPAAWNISTQPALPHFYPLRHRTARATLLACTLGTVPTHIF